MIPITRCARPTGPICCATATRIAEGPVADVLNQAQLEELYRAPVERLVDPQTGAVAFLPG